MAQFTYAIESTDTRIRFPSKPPEAIRAMLKGAGFRWSPSAGCWWRRGCKGAADFLTALDRKMNPGRPDGACWRCKSLQGFFRQQGPATPVYCNECWAILQDNLAKADRGEPVPAIDKPEHTCAGMHDISCEACHADRFDLDYEDRCRDACGL